ncbi:MAG: ATP-binding protein [Pseudomonadota bacterium]
MRKDAFGFIFLILLGPLAYSQPSYLEQDHWLTDHFEVADGLPVNSINALALGPEGYLWIATFDGLVRFDGERFVTFNRGTNPELPGNRFIGVQWSSGYLWIQTAEQRLLRMTSPGQFEVLDEGDGLPHSRVSRLLATDQGFFAGTRSGVARLRPDGTFQNYSETFSSAVASLVFWPGQGLAAGTPDGELFVLNDNAPPRSLPLPDHLGRVSSLAVFSGQLAVGASGGVLVIGADGNDEFLPVDQEPMEAVRVVTFEDELRAYAFPDQLLWRAGRWEPVGSMSRQPIDAGALLRRAADGARWSNELFRLERDGIPLFATDTIIKDFLPGPRGEVWVATNGSGLFRVRRREVLTIGSPDGVRFPNLYSVHEEQGELMAGTQDPLAYQIRFSGAEVEVTEIAPPGGYFSFLRDSLGNLWRGGSRICVGPPDQDACSPLAGLDEIQQHQFVNAMFEDAQGNIWVGAERNLAVRRPGGDWRLIAPPAGTAETSYRAALQTPDGRVWFGTNGNGIAVLSGGEFEQGIDAQDGLSSVRVRALHYHAGRNAVWAGTEDGGICRITEWPSSPRVDCVTDRQGLWSNGVHKLLADDQDRLWMSSNRGLFWASLSSLHAVADGTADWVLGLAYDERDGMADREANGGSQNAGLRAANGWVWFPTQAGLAGINPAAVQAPADVRVRIDTLVYDSQPQRAADSFDIQPDNRNLEIRYSAPGLGNAKRVRYRYRLGGEDAAWVEVGGRTFASFSSLPVGNAKFEVEASREDGAWSGHVASLQLNVVPRMFETMWFRILITVVAVTLLMLDAWWRIRQLKIRQGALESAVSERTAELSAALSQISEQKDEIEASAEARARLFGSLSHELRTPLSLILGPMEERARRRRPVTAEDEAMMLRNARRLNRMVDQILDLERVESGALVLNLEPVSCSEVLRAVADPFGQLAAAKNLSWELDTANGCHIQGDREQLEKVFANLFSNAVKYTPADGTVIITCRCYDQRVMVRVEDSGPGISEANRQEAFARFSRLKRDAAEPGTGIGLSLVRELVELHQGTVSISTSGALGGACLTLDLPAAAVAAIPDGVPTGRRQVLVVDDNPDLRDYVESILSENYAVLQAGDGLEGLQLARENLPDVIVTDVMMPGLDGLGMVAELRAGGDESTIPVVFLTARGGATDEIAALAAGGDQYLAKPFDSEVLRARIEAVMASADRLRGLAALAGPEPRDELELRMRNYVLERLDDAELSVSAIASALGMSRSNLFRQVKSRLGTTPTLLVRRIRLNAAKAWLADPDVAISEVAYGAGFSSLSSFGRAFREEFGVSASAYREQGVEAPPDRTATL